MPTDLNTPVHHHLLTLAITLSTVLLGTSLASAVETGPTSYARDTIHRSGATQPVVDGSRDAAYGDAIVLQTVQTQFDDATDPTGLGIGGELDAAYGTIVSGRLYVLLTGNIEPNFNKINIFIDSQPGGENVLDGSLTYDFLDSSQNLGGLTFDTGFEADFHLFGRWGGSAFDLEFIDRAASTSGAELGNTGTGTSTGGAAAIQTGTILAIGGTAALGADGGTVLTEDIPFGFNNTNVLGVGPGSAAADPAAAAAVTTGVEFSIALSDIGDPAGDIKIHAHYANGDHNFLSNQILGGVPAPQGNLGGDGSGGFIGDLSEIDFTQFAGDQFFVVSPPVPDIPFFEDGFESGDLSAWTTP